MATLTSNVRSFREFSGAGTALNAILFDVDSSLVDAGVLQLTGTFVGTVLLEGSVDRVTWVALPWITANLATANPSIAGITAVGQYLFNAPCQYVRGRVSAYTSGSIVAVGGCHTGELAFTTEQVTVGALPVGTSVIGATPLSASATVGVGTTSGLVRAAASTNLTSLKASAGKLHGYMLTNTTAGIVYVKFYNKASAPVLASDVPLFTVLIPANSEKAYCNSIGKAFTTGIAYAITGLLANTDATAVTLDSVIGHLDYI